MAAKKKQAMTDEQLVRELREFHHYEAARRLEQLSRMASVPSAPAVVESVQECGDDALTNIVGKDQS